MEEGTYPRGPEHVPPGLTRPTRAYRRHAYLAVAGLLAFVALYVALTTWFAWTAYRLFATVVYSPDDWSLVFPGAAAGFLAVFLAKALIFVRRSKPDGLIELTAAEHPKLFAFLHRLADEARAPRPRRVLAAPSVNAAVFYDFSLINLIIPSSKNLLVGLGLVNVLTLGELKAVLAHEFGHFAQNTMAIGRWVYMAQQIAGHIVVKRDALDGLLRSLSGTDIRIAWVGWVLRIVVWSLRSVMDTVFGWVVLAQRALGREMELQADLVAVSLTGSDALVHALHRLEAADDAMDRVVGFAGAERGRGKAVADVFTLQTHMLERTRAIIGDPSFGVVPALPTAPADHRLFKAKLAQPPRMWSTHPPNDVREANAKRIYISAPLDDRSSWLLFEQPDALRAAVTARMYAPEPEAGEQAEAKPDEKPVETPPIETSLAALDAELDKRYLDPRYHGAYLGRSIVRVAAKVDELYGSVPAAEAVVAALDALYPPSLAGDLARLRELSEQHALLEALQRGILEAPGGVVRHRGQEHHRREIPKLLAEVDRELDEVRAALCEHDRRVRTAHLAAARAVSPGWEAYLRGLAAIHHFADHRRADLEDAAGALQNILAVVFADGRVTSSELERVVAAAHALFDPLRSIHGQAAEIELGALAGKLEIASFKDALEPLHLPAPSDDNIGEWLDAVGGWVGDAVSALSALSRVSLDELVRTEEEVARRVRAAAGGKLVEAGAPISALAPATGEQADAPAPPRPPASYPTLVPGSQRPRQLKLGWWDRFQVADGIVATAARFIVAAAIIACVVWAGRATGSATLYVVNGLARPVVVAFGSSSLEVAAHGHAKLDTDAGDYAIRATTRDGQVVEELDVTVDRAFGHYVYNVAGAAALVEWHARSSRGRVFATPHWRDTAATEVFDSPDEARTSRDDSAVLINAAVMHPWLVPDEVAADRPMVALAHARWDPPGSVYLAAWLSEVQQRPELPALLRARLATDPDDVAARRVEQDLGPHDEVCARHREKAAAAADSPAWQYLAARCLEDGAAPGRFAQLADRWPQHGWVLFAAGNEAFERGDYDRAMTWLEAARTRLAEYRDRVVDRIARARRLRDRSPVPIGELGRDSPMLNQIAALEPPYSDRLSPAGHALRVLYRGDVAEAVADGALQDPGLLMLAAASDDAPEALIARVLGESPDKLQPMYAVYGLALARRVGRDPQPYRQRFASAFKQAVRADAFFAALDRDPRAAEAGLEGLPFEIRTHLLAAGTVVLGYNAPVSWREVATLGLFPSERPFFH